MTLTSWSAAQMHEAIDSGDLVLVDLRADWCSQCGPQERVLERLLPVFGEQVRFGSVDVGEHTAVVDEYGVKGLPTLLVFRGGQHQTTLNGFKRAPEVRQALERVLQDA